MRVETGLLSLGVEAYAGLGQRAPTLAEIAAAAREVEDLGFDVATAPEAGCDPFLPLVVAAEHTQRIQLATNVAIAFPRSPLVVAQMAWDLQRLPGGRFQLGLGTQVKGHNERRYGTPWVAPPGPGLREYLLCLHAIFATFENGRQPRYFQGRWYQFTLMSPFFHPGPTSHPRPPISIAAVNPYMCRLAGELCEGVRLHPIATFGYVRAVVLPALEEGAKKAGRHRDDIEVVGAPFLALGRDERELAAAKREAKQRIAFYASTRTYHSVLEFHGWAEAGRELHQLFLQGKWTEMADVITDEMLAEFAVVGPPEELAVQIARRCGDLFNSVLLDLPPWLRNDRRQLRAAVTALHGVGAAAK